MGFGKILKTVIKSDENVSAALELGGLAKKAGKGLAAGGFALGDKLKHLKDGEDKEIIEQETTADITSDYGKPISEQMPENKGETEFTDIPGPGNIPVENTAAPSSGGYSLDNFSSSVRCPGCGAMVDSKSEDCPQCKCKISGNPDARSGPL